MSYKYPRPRSMRGVEHQIITALRLQRRSGGALSDAEAMRVAEYTPFGHYGSPDFVGGRKAYAQMPEWQKEPKLHKALQKEYARVGFFDYGPSSGYWPGERHALYPEEFGAHVPGHGRWMVESAPKLTRKQLARLKQARETIELAHYASGRRRPLRSKARRSR
jgi:hypothetical protein